VTVEVGSFVRYEVQRSNGESFPIAATVVGFTPKRIIIAFPPWRDGREIRRAVRPHKVSVR